MTDVALIDTLRLKENGSFTFRVEVKDIQGESGHEVPFPAKHMIGLPAAGMRQRHASKPPFASCSIANRKNRFFQASTSTASPITSRTSSARSRTISLRFDHR